MGNGHAWRVLLAIAAGHLALALPGCSSTPKPVEACLRVNASPNLNLYDGQPHVVTLYLFPLSSTVGFEQTGVGDLLGGATPPGVEGSPVHVLIAPGESKKKFEDFFPSSTTQIGVVADYYRSPVDPEGVRRQIVPARCGWWRKPKLRLSAKDLYRE
jgi:type VI secretion system VasD/TssJ family lipoprotein